LAVVEVVVDLLIQVVHLEVQVAAHKYLVQDLLQELQELLVKAMLVDKL
jgi:hypothetical protein